MASKQEDDAIALVGLLVAMKCKKKRKRTAWCKDWLTKRNEYTHTRLLKELSSDPTDYRNYLRMNEEVYQKLLSLVTPLIQKKNTVMRTSISPHERLTALGKIIPETCEAICNVLKKVYFILNNSFYSSKTKF